MKNTAEERWDVCARLWPGVELRLINSIDDASVAKHDHFLSLITLFLFSGHSLSCEEILVMQRIAGFPVTEFECRAGIDALGGYMER